MDGMTQQSGFSGGVSGADSPSTSAVDTATTTSGTETTTIDSPSTGGDGGSTHPATATAETEKTVAQSEKGSFKLVYNERTGRNEVVSTMPQESEANEYETQAPAKQTEANESKPQAETKQNDYSGTELLQFAQMLQQQPPQPVYYPPVQPPQPAPQPQQQAPAEDTGADEVAQAKEYYNNVNKLAQERAMQEVGITQDELDVAEYSDDQELLDKVSAYKAAIESNRTRIMNDVENIRRVHEAERADHANAYQAVVNFANEMKKKEPNFAAIDKLMTSRVAQMPYEKASKIVPLLQKVANGTLTTADLPALQEMYNETRLEFYSKREGVGLAPQAQKPSFVETPGTGGDVPRQTTPLSALGKMSKRDREAAIGQMFGNFFDE
jgi:hypothetical protein